MAAERLDHTKDGVLWAPWSQATVDVLNEFQQSGVMHPFTCAGEHTPGSPVLIATKDGWRCPQPYGEPCDYKQMWAQPWMAHKRLWENIGLRGMLKRNRCTDQLPCGECRTCGWRARALSAESALSQVTGSLHHLEIFLGHARVAQAMYAGTLVESPSEKEPHGTQGRGAPSEQDPGAGVPGDGAGPVLDG